MHRDAHLFARRSLPCCALLALSVALAPRSVAAQHAAPSPPLLAGQPESSHGPSNAGPVLPFALRAPLVSGAAFAAGAAGFALALGVALFVRDVLDAPDTATGLAFFLPWTMMATANLTMATLLPRRLGVLGRAPWKAFLTSLVLVAVVHPLAWVLVLGRSMPHTLGELALLNTALAVGGTLTVELLGLLFRPADEGHGQLAATRGETGLGPARYWW